MPWVGPGTAAGLALLAALVLATLTPDGGLAGARETTAAAHEALRTHERPRRRGRGGGRGGRRGGGGGGGCSDTEEGCEPNDLGEVLAQTCF